ncbi:MAG: type II toxin-antitoxin system PemK/MazF family toxin [Betaproteobacteria bacterium]
MKRGEVWAETGKIKARHRLREDCQIMPEQPRTLDRRRLVDRPLAVLSAAEMGRVERSLSAILGLPWQGSASTS